MIISGFEVYRVHDFEVANYTLAHATKAVLLRQMRDSSRSVRFLSRIPGVDSRIF